MIFSSTRFTPADFSFHSSHALREFSVKRFSSLNPFSSANFLAPSPTKHYMFRFLHNKFCNPRLDFLIPSIPATEPALPFQSIIDASRLQSHLHPAIHRNRQNYSLDHLQQYGFRLQLHRGEFLPLSNIHMLFLRI